jgi:hypothetical protein
MTENPFCNRTHDKVLQAAPSVCSEHNQIDVQITDQSGNDFPHVSSLHGHSVQDVLQASALCKPVHLPLSRFALGFRVAQRDSQRPDYGFLTYYMQQVECRAIVQRYCPSER